MRKKKKYLKNRKKILLLVLAVIAFFLAFYYLIPMSLFVPDLSTYGFSEVLIDLEIKEDEGLLKFFNNCYGITMVIDRGQAISISDGIAGKINYRPNAHDLINDILNGLDTKILMIKITEMKDNTYFAKILLKKGNLVLSLDSRPSDAIAIAARVPYLVNVYVNETLLKTVGEKIC